MEILLYGLRAGETERWAEELLIAREGLTEQQIETVKEAAAKDGFHSFRVTTWDGTPPNFTKVLK